MHNFTNIILIVAFSCACIFIYRSTRTVYYDVPGTQDSNNNSAAARDDDDDEDIVAGDGIVELLMDFSDRFATSRLFEIRVTQIPFSQRAPAGCLQYFTGAEGIIQVG